MPLVHLFDGVIAKTRGMSKPLRYMGSTGITLGLFMMRRALDPLWPTGYPFLLLFVAVIVSATLFNGKSGYWAVALSAALASYFYLPPYGSLMISGASNVAATVLFVGTGLFCAMLVETLHHALEDRAIAIEHWKEAEEIRTLQLREFRHRTRNDLQNLVGLLLLRARGAATPELKEGLKEAAGHAMALARVHTRLTVAADPRFAAEVDTHEFITGLVQDLASAHQSQGIRAVAFRTSAEAHAIDAERAVHLGMVLNEAITNALKYAYPEEGGGILKISFKKQGGSFLLCVEDDGVGIPFDNEIANGGKKQRGAGMGTRLLAALAAQLGGTITRRGAEGGRGTVTELRFPAASPSQRKPA